MAYAYLGITIFPQKEEIMQITQHFIYIQKLKQKRKYAVKKLGLSKSLQQHWKTIQKRLRDQLQAQKFYG